MTNNLTKTVGVGVLTLTMGILPLSFPAQAQVTQPRTDTAAPNRVVYDDRTNTDWGWLGLIGLLGLAGLAGKKRDEEPTRYRDPNAPGASSYRD
ncbi:WGxxGxxG family protein [Anabaena sp. WFMT]|uniref:WGxxGxxG family protein n=1 Tax=Anabaena sp. WFMT TaxID=3449730 RepID=UPI003F227DE3